MKAYPNEHVKIVGQNQKKEFQYRNTTVLTVDISYPQIAADGFSLALQRINIYYRQVAARFMRHAADELYPSAVQDYRYAMENGFPFRPYTAVMDFTVTQNGSCRLSVYFDQYEYTGGAHGSTLRISDNRDLQTGRRIAMHELFRLGERYRKKVIGQILKQADGNMAAEPHIYFNDYRQLIVRYFDPEHYFLTPTGLSVFYLQYEIAPYSTGIVVFDLPYASLGIEKPRCGRRPD